MQARQCWTVLADKAQKACERIQAELKAAQQRMHSLQASEARLRQLQAEYLQSSVAVGTELTGMQDAINQRHFLQQLGALLDKVMQDQIHARIVLVQTRERLQQAERERMKMQSLMDQDLRQQRLQAQRLEQKQFDELAVRQFNLRHA